MPGSINVKGTWKTVSNFHVKQSGAWKEVSNVYINQNGVWKEAFSAAPPSIVVLSPTIDTNNAVTGGWTATLAGGTTGPVMSTSGNVLGLRAPYWCDGDARTNNNINLTGAKSITLDWASSGVSPSYFYANINWPTTTGEAGYTLGSPSFANIARNTVTIPVTNGANGKLRLRVTNSNGGYVYIYGLTINY